MAAVLRRVEKVRGRDIPILVLGRTGTDKEWLARAIHHDSPRRDAPFVAVNCASLPDTLIAIAGIEKVIPRYMDLEVLLQTLPRSATGERMNPYNSIWTGVTAEDGPQRFHVVLLDNGRSEVLADESSRQTLRCIRCGACQNACPVYRQTGGHAYGSVYAGPIGAILTPQLHHMEQAQSLPYASSLCGACYEVCPVQINIPEVLVHLRGRVVEKTGHGFSAAFKQERIGMKMMSRIFMDHRRFEAAQKLARVAQWPLVSKDAWIHWLPGMAGHWTAARDLRPLPPQSFREWWRERDGAHAAAESGAT